MTVQPNAYDRLRSIGSLDFHRLQLPLGRTVQLEKIDGQYALWIGELYEPYTGTYCGHKQFDSKHDKSCDEKKKFTDDDVYITLMTEELLAQRIKDCEERGEQWTDDEEEIPWNRSFNIMNFSIQTVFCQQNSPLPHNYNLQTLRVDGNQVSFRNINYMKHNYWAIISLVHSEVLDNGNFCRRSHQNFTIPLDYGQNMPTQPLFTSLPQNPERLCVSSTDRKFILDIRHLCGNEYLSSYIVEGVSIVNLLIDRLPKVLVMIILEYQLLRDDSETGIFKKEDETIVVSGQIQNLLPLIEVKSSTIPSFDVSHLFPNNKLIKILDGGLVKFLRYVTPWDMQKRRMEVEEQVGAAWIHPNERHVDHRLCWKADSTDNKIESDLELDIRLWDIHQISLFSVPRNRKFIGSEREVSNIRSTHFCVIHHADDASLDFIPDCVVLPLNFGEAQPIHPLFKSTNEENALYLSDPRGDEIVNLMDLEIAPNVEGFLESCTMNGHCMCVELMQVTGLEKKMVLIIIHYGLLSTNDADSWVSEPIHFFPHK